MRRALGKGLSQLLGNPSAPPESAQTSPPLAAPEPVKAVVRPPAKSTEEPGGLAQVSIDEIQANSRQPREHFDEEALADLAASIREHGVLQPLIVRARKEGGYELIAGERRLRAARLAGLTTVPAILREATDPVSLELALVENLQREDISPMELARAYRRLMDEFGLSQERVAEKVGKSRPAVANALRLLRLPEPIQEGLHAGAISEGHARALLGLAGAGAMLELYEQILIRGLSVRDVERLVRAAQEGDRRSEPRPRPALDPNWVALQDGLGVYFGAPVRLEKGAHGGKLVVEFFSDDDLQRILEVLGVTL